MFIDMSELDDLKKALQRRIGAKDDGDIGPKTIGIINDKLDELDTFRGVAPGPSTVIPMLPSPPKADGSLVISQLGLDQIVYFEIGSESYYTSHLRAPSWPGWASGVTVGVGYDLGYNSDDRIRKDWAGVIDGWMVDLLTTVNQYRGSSAKSPAGSLRKAGVVIELDEAKHVFQTSTLPRFAALALKAYPGLDKLTPDAQSAILSLCFNRGTSMANTDKRSEMRDLRPAIANGDTKKISALLLRMQRHWSKTSGLFTRRAREARLVAEGNREYAEGDLIIV